MRIVVGTGDFVAVGFDVPVAEFVPRATLGARDAIARLGPDLLSAEFDADAACARLRARGGSSRSPTPCSNQRVMAGIGNVYKSEVLFAGGVHPRTPLTALADDQLMALIQIARQQLAMNVRETSAPGSGHRRTTGRLSPHEGLWVYGRRGEPCRRCGTPIASAKQGFGARPTYWCPTCQVQKE